MPMPILPRPINPTVSMLPPHLLWHAAHSNSAPNTVQGAVDPVLLQATQPATPLLIETTLQATQVGNLAQMLVLFTDQLAEHTANGKIVRQGASAAHLREWDALGMDVERAGVNTMQVREGL